MSVEESIVRICAEKDIMIALAESCTGGLISKMITDVAGASSCLDRGAVTYGNGAKIDMLDVDPAIIEEHGAVSGECAEAMACGMLKRSDAAVALAVTGIAGPTGGTKEKPVGTVWFALAVGAGNNIEVNVEKVLFEGTRAKIRHQAAEHGLDILLDAIEKI